uniref:Methyltransf_11 domain-containing protein n=1 Tax=Schistosoma mansoni TaxID=6183 RepID=A0A5K4EZX1_SCHMA
MSILFAILANKLHQHIIHQFSCSLKKPTSNFYSKYLYQYKLKKQNKLLTAAAIDACNLKPGDNVLEIGFGQGDGIQLAVEYVAPITVNHWKSSRIKFILENVISTSTIQSNKFKNDGHVYGIEISEYMLQKARNYGPLLKLIVLTYN